MEARGEGEVGEGADVVVGEVDGVLILAHTSGISHPSRNLDIFLRGGGGFLRDLCDAEIFDGGDFVACGIAIMISMELIPMCSICSFSVWYAPLRSSSRSLRGFRYEREF